MHECGGILTYPLLPFGSLSFGKTSMMDLAAANLSSGDAVKTKKMHVGNDFLPSLINMIDLVFHSSTISSDMVNRPDRKTEHQGLI